MKPKQSDVPKQRRKWRLSEIKSLSQKAQKVIIEKLLKKKIIFFFFYSFKNPSIQQASEKTIKFCWLLPLKVISLDSRLRVTCLNELRLGPSQDANVPGVIIYTVCETMRWQLYPSAGALYRSDIDEKRNVVVNGFLLLLHFFPRPLPR